MKRYTATFSNGNTFTSKLTEKKLTVAWCIMHDDHILFKGFSQTREMADKQMNVKLNNITGRSDIGSTSPVIQRRVIRYNRENGQGSYEDYVKSEEAKYTTEMVRV